MSGSWSQPGVLGICRAVQGQLQDREALWGQLILHRSLSGQRTPALEGRVCLLPGPEAPLQAVRVLFFFFCPAGSSTSLLSASPRMPWALCCACQGHCGFPAVSAAFPGWQMFPYLCLSTHHLSVHFPIVTRSLLGLLLQQGVSGAPSVPAARNSPGSGSNPQESLSCAGHWELPVLVPIPCLSRPWGGQPPPRVPPWQLPAQVLLLTPCSRVVWKRGWRGGTSVGTAASPAVPSMGSCWQSSAFLRDTPVPQAPAAPRIPAVPPE